ncbi:hypothetical protein [Streptomyces sp. HSG2]|uniref:hypothetical protein n=1 Tax=Streptomyces sp. HSG2 TaxID=2797167 RepID=UPI0019038C6F|nr:hypothetical protein [Streptomyces sp. HSG2]
METKATGGTSREATPADPDPDTDPARTKRADEAGADRNAPRDIDAGPAGGDRPVAEPEEADGAPDAPASAPEREESDDVPSTEPTEVGQGAGAVVAAALGVVSLTGGWVGTIASARRSLIGQLETTSSSDIAQMIEKGYGEAWRATALWGGLFAVVALLVGLAVLARPAFGTPGPRQTPWITSVAWAGVALGALGLVLAVLTYTGVLLGLPSTG